MINNGQQANLIPMEMTVEIVKPEHKETILSLQPGQPFEYSGELYVRIHEIKTAAMEDGAIFNKVVGVRLSDGCMFFISEGGEDAEAVVPNVTVHYNMPPVA